MKTLKLLPASVAAASLMMAGVAAKVHAEVDISANIGVTSNYVWRGASQSDDGPAVSGGLDLEHASGFYIGTWVSSVDFEGSGETEFDVYAGFAGEIEGFAYDVGIAHFMYPVSDEDIDFTEIYAEVGFDFFFLGAAYIVDSDADEGPFRDKDYYLYAGLSFDLPRDFGLTFTVGRWFFKDDGKTVITGPAPGDFYKYDLDYTHYQLDLTRSAGDFGDVTFSLSKAGKQANVDTAGDPDSSLRAFVSWEKTF